MLSDWFEQEVRYRSLIPGFHTLPRVLIPRREILSMPLVMHYGWSMDHLIDYAAKYDLTVRGL